MGSGKKIWACSAALQRSGKVMALSHAGLCVFRVSVALRMASQPAARRWFRGHRLHDVHCLWPSTAAAVDAPLQLCVFMLQFCSEKCSVNWSEYVCASYTCQYQWALAVTNTSLCTWVFSGSWFLCVLFQCQPLVSRGPKGLFFLSSGTVWFIFATGLSGGSFTAPTPSEY